MRRSGTIDASWPETACVLVLLAAWAGVRSAEAQGGQLLGWGSNGNGQAQAPLPTLLPFRQVAGGGSNTVAVLGDGTVRAWGDNFYGQSDTTSLVQVRRLAVGFDFGIALRNDGALAHWGRDRFELKSGAAAISSVLAVSAGVAHALAIREDRTVVAWGAGLLNEGTSPHLGQSMVPTGLDDVLEVAAGGFHSLALRMNGSVRAWGAGETIGGGTHAFGQSMVPDDLAGVAHVAAGRFHSVAVLHDGRVRSWGRPVSPAGHGEFDALSGAVGVAAGFEHTSVLKADGTVVVRGDNSFGQRDVPDGLAGIVEVAAGAFHTVARRGDGTVVVWGLGTSGQTAVPRRVAPAVAASAGAQHTVVLQSDGTVTARGCNDFNQAVVPGDLGSVIQVVAGARHSVALRVDGTVVAWGAGRLNTGSDPQHGQSIVPGGLPAADRIAAGRFHTLALLDDRTVRAWGAGTVDSGQHPHFGQSRVPEGLTDVTEVSAGGFHSLARRADGRVVAWGAGTLASSSPHFGQSVVPADLDGVSDVAAGGFHSLALRSNGTVRAWGGVDPAESIPPAGLSGVRQIAAAWRHSLALLADGTVVPWGRDDWGQFPPAALADVLQVACGGDPDHAHSLAILGNGPSGCSNPGGSGTAVLSVSGTDWQQAEAWSWSADVSPQVPGLLTNASLGAYGSVGSLCDARCATLEVPGGSTLLVPVDLTQPLSSQDHSIDVGGLARLQGRVWLLASGASVLPADFSVPVVNAGSFDGLFSIIQSTLPAPAGKFLTLVPSSSLGGGTTWSLALRDLPGAFGSGTGGSAEFNGVAVAAEAMDLDGDGFDDLALVIDNGPSQPGHLQVILNDGSGNLGNADTAYRVDTAPRPVAIAVGDLDGDGDDDAAVATASNLSARVYLNTLADGFSLGGQPLVPSTVLAVGAVPTCVAVVPVPQPRVAVGSAAANSVAVFEPTASEALQVVTVPVAPAAMGRRGRIILSGGANPSSIDGLLPSALGRLVVLTPGGDGAYALTQSVGVPGKPRNLDVADIDRDGIEDAITANLDPQQVATGTPLAVLTLFRGTASGVGQAVPIAPQGATAGGDVAMVDVNDDGVRDLVSVHQTLVGQSAAAAILVNQSEPGGALTLGTQEPIAASRPILCPRGDVLGPQAEGVFIVDSGTGASLTESPRAIPYRAEVPPAPPCVGDLNGDSAVDGVDLGILLGAWGPVTGGSAADFNQDGAVDGVDLGVLLARWGACQA